ncbi:MAG: WD40/YVTN/BNR-like repeat-containing protein [Vicinamibacterales bacterium]
MSQVRSRFRRPLLLAAGVAALLSPFAGDLVAQSIGTQAQAPSGDLLNAPTDPRLQGFRFRSIGPTGQGGRIDDLAVVEQDPSTFYIGYAVSGLWKTVNNGITFEQLFKDGNHSIGDIGIAPSNPDIIYVGTGEPNNRQSSSFGDGVYKSTDAGKTWTHLGLRETQSIGRVIVHPKNPDIVWVAAVGHLFGPNEERGVFMTTDGGKSWQKTLYINQDVGATDLVIDPSNPNILFAATYERRRTSWGFVGGGPGSGLHRSNDGGKTWTKVTGNGLPNGTMGRIGLDFSRSNPNVIYAQIEVAPDKEPASAPAGATAGQAQQAQGRAGAPGGGQAGGGRGGAPAPPDPQSSGVWRSMDKGRTWTFMSNENQRPMYYSQIRVDPNNHDTIYVGGVNPRKSLDGGKTWINLTGMGHVDNHAIWINPRNSKHVMYGNDGGLDVSYDAGENWESVRLQAVGLPYHVSVDMRRPYWVCTGLQDNGSWCGPSSQRSGGIYMWNWISVGGGDGFQTQVDPTDPNIFYTESQNGNINRYDLNTGTTTNIRPRLTGGGRGGAGGGQSNIIGDLPDEQTMQFNWNSPIRISPHNPQTILFAGRHVFVSRDRGTTWTMTAPMGKGIDINQRNILEQSYSLPGCGRGAGPGTRCILSKHDGYVNNEFGTVVELEESPKVPGLLWAGTDDGNLQVSRDFGQTWTEVGKNIPGGTREYHISGIQPSYFDANTAYVSLDGHRNNDHTAYVFKTTDLGRTWTSVAGDLPRGNVNQIRQDPKAASLLYAPTEYGFYVSLNEGRNWMKFSPGLPAGRVDEVVIHPRDNDLVLATHGYSIWIMDDITPLQQMANAAPSAPTLFTPREAVQWKTDRRNQTEVPGAKHWVGENAPRGTAISYFLPSATTEQVLVTITNTATGQDVRSCLGTGNAGLNRYQWTLSGNPGAGGGGGGRGGQQAQQQQAPQGPQPCNAAGAGGGRGGFGGGFGGGGGIGPGVYRVTLSIGGKQVGAETFTIVEDVWLNEK